MKRWPILVSFVLFVGLCASVTFWAMQFTKPAPRPVAMPKQADKTGIDPEAALALFGGRAAPVAAASNYQLRGVVVARYPEESVAILVADSKPAEAIRVNTEIEPGVTVKEVHSQFVLLSDGGVIKRVELPADVPQLHVDSPVGIQPVTPVGIQPVAAPMLPTTIPVGAPNLAPPPPPHWDATKEGVPPLPPPNAAVPRPGHTGRHFGNDPNLH